MEKLHYRPLAESDIGRFRSLAGESLLVPQDDVWDRFIARIGRSNLRGMVSDEVLIATSGFYPMHQWFGGKAVSVAGISVVSVDIAHRGKGVCGTMLRKLLQELHDSGTALACLYASTEVPYRSVGFEQAGLLTKYKIPLASLGQKPSDMPIVRYEEPPLDQLIQIADQKGRLNNGYLQRNAAMWQRVLLPYFADKTYTYIFGSPGQPEGYVVVMARSRENSDYSTLVASDVAMNTPQATDRLIKFLNDHRSVTTSFMWRGAPDDELLGFAADGQYEVVGQERWLNRILRLSDSLATRGYPSYFSGAVHFEITDELFPGNAGRWVLNLRDGSPEVKSGGDGSIRLSINAMSPLYSGMYSASRLHQMGWIECQDPRQLLVADQAFAGPAPWMPETF